MSKIIGPVASIIAVLFLLSACQFRPLHGGSDNAKLTNVSVGEVETRTGQQVRNHLLFLLNGGNAPEKPTYWVNLTVSFVNKTLANVQAVQDRTAGSVEVNVSYNMIDLATSKVISSGKRFASAAYDRTGQSFANSRAQRDAENRAAKETAEAVKLAIAADLSRIGAGN